MRLFQGIENRYQAIGENQTHERGGQPSRLRTAASRSFDAHESDFPVGFAWLLDAVEFPGLVADWEGCLGGVSGVEDVGGFLFQVAQEHVQVYLGSSVAVIGSGCA